MCNAWKNAIGRGKHDNDNKENGNKQGQQQENNSSLSIVIAAEQISGLHYNFDTASCALMFKKFIDIYMEADLHPVINSSLSYCQGK
jgi:hypothetical protein